MRFERQFELIKTDGQNRLLNAIAAIIALGGHGCAVQTYLAYAGIKT